MKENRTQGKGKEGAGAGTRQAGRQDSESVYIDIEYNDADAPRMYR